jgi:hypothetical protein
MWCCSAAVIKCCSSKSCNTATQQYLNNFNPTINVAGKAQYCKSIRSSQIRNGGSLSGFMEFVEFVGFIELTQATQQTQVTQVTQ